MNRPQYRCERCERGVREDERYYVESADEYWCEDCIQNKAEADYERMCENFHDGGCTSFPDGERKRMEEARKLK